MWRRALPRLREGTSAEGASIWQVVRNRYVLALGVVALAIALAVLDVGSAIYIYLLFIVVGTFRPRTPGIQVPG